jgi:hypothetical protein
MGRESEVVVRGKIDDRGVIERRRRLLFAFEDPEPSVETLRLDRVELGSEVPERVAAHGVSI